MKICWLRELREVGKHWKNSKNFKSARADRFIPSDLVSPLYSGMTNNILLGTEEEKLYTEKLLKDIKNAPPKKGKTHLLDAYHSILV